MSDKTDTRRAALAGVEPAVQGLGFKARESGIMVSGFRFRDPGFWVWDFGFGILGLKF